MRLRRLVVIALAVFPWLLLNPDAFARDLTFEDRVNAQEAIQRVYYSHQIGATKPFEEAVPRSVLERKVLAYLKESVALEQKFDTLVSPRALRDEMQRIAANSQLPERLEEIYAALDRDSFLIQECFVRPLLVERLAREQFASDWRFHGMAWEDWWPSFETLLVPAAPRIPASGPTMEEASTRLWKPDDTLPKGTFGQAPSRRLFSSAVWTGTLMIVWGGQDESYNVTNTGGRYDPVTDTWTPTAMTGAPEARSAHTSVWTGTEMIVWGGFGAGGPIATGGRYDPATDSWSPAATVNAPAARDFHTAIWTGSRMVVWGGGSSNVRDSGGQYDPGTDTWVATSTTNAPTARFLHTAVWTGDLMVVWGGVIDYAHGSTPLDTGGRYDPLTDTWTPTSTLNAPTARMEHTAVWAGSAMIVWGGQRQYQGLDSLNTGGLYDPATDSWTPVSTTDAPAARTGHTAVWTGSRMIVWGGMGTAAPYYFASGGRYDPATSSWSPTANCDAPEGRPFHVAVWTDKVMIVWGGGREVALDSGGRYEPAQDAWRPTSNQSVDLDGDGYSVCQLDCDDTNPRVHPGAIERCNGVDDDCDGRIDEDFSVGHSCTEPVDACHQVLGATQCRPDGTGTECGGAIVVHDTTPPDITVVADPEVLWPPNHQMVPVHVHWQASDLCDPRPVVTLVSVTSSEPDDAPGVGDGKTTGDIAGVDPGTADGEIELRAERSDNGQGRVYRIVYSAVDASGNTTPAMAVVTVPHDKR